MNWVCWNKEYRKIYICECPLDFGMFFLIFYTILSLINVNDYDGILSFVVQKCSIYSPVHQQFLMSNVIQLTTGLYPVAPILCEKIQMNELGATVPYIWKKCNSLCMKTSLFLTNFLISEDILYITSISKSFFELELQIWSL